MSEALQKPALDERRTFDCWVSEKMRFGDTDLVGHVNNAVFAVMSETGRVAYLRETALPVIGDGRTWVIVRIELDYRAEVHWPSIVEIGTRLLSVGSSSLRLCQGMFVGENCVATAENVLVLMDLTTRKATKLPEPLREALLGRLIS